MFDNDRMIFEQTMTYFQTRKILGPSFDDLHSRADLRVSSRCVDERKGSGHVRTSAGGGIVRACVGTRMKLTPAIPEDDLKIGGMQDDMGATVRSVRTADIATESAEIRVGSTHTRVGSCSRSGPCRCIARVVLQIGEKCQTVGAVVLDVLGACLVDLTLRRSAYDVGSRAQSDRDWCEIAGGGRVHALSGNLHSAYETIDGYAARAESHEDIVGFMYLACRQYCDDRG